MDLRPSPPVYIAQNFAVPPKAVFEAWLNPDIVRRWMFVSPENEIQDVRIDPRPGGTFSILEWTGTEHIDHFGEFRIIEGPNRLVFTLEVPKHFSGQTWVSVIIAPHLGGCSMTFSQAGVDRNVTDENWREMFATLAHLLNAPRAATFAPQARRSGRLFPNTKIAKHDIENFVHLYAAGQSAQRPGRTA